MFNVLFLCATLFAPLQHAINSIFYQAYLEGCVQTKVGTFFPSYMFWGSWVTNCVDSASLAFHSSRKNSALLIDAIVNQGAVSLADHFAHLDMVHAAVTRSREDQYQLSLSSVCLL